MGETLLEQLSQLAAYAFSILERIDVGETKRPWQTSPCRATFSILERIDVGETLGTAQQQFENLALFQYPRTDRRG